MIQDAGGASIVTAPKDKVHGLFIENYMLLISRYTYTERATPIALNMYQCMCTYACLISALSAAERKRISK